MLVLDLVIHMPITLYLRVFHFVKLIDLNLDSCLSGHQQDEVENKKETNQPYTAGYTNRQANYITREDVKDSYIAQYGTKKALKDTEMENKEHVSVWFLFAHYSLLGS